MAGERRRATRRKILDAAREIFFRDGFEAANLDEIASRAGLAKGTIYRHFESKAELYVAVLSHNAEVFVRRMQETVDPSLAPEEQIRRTGTFYFRHYAENREYFRIFWALENQRMIGELPERLVRAVLEVWRRCLSILADQIEQGVKAGLFAPCDPWEIANIFWIVGNGVIQSDEDPERRALRGRPLERVFEDALDLLLRGLRSADAAPSAGAVRRSR
jgi:AcrR family transcriptional regulator